MKKLTSWDLYKSIGSPKFICAPMVDQSELPFRLLVKKHGADLCYTPMLHSKIWCSSEEYRLEKFSTCKEDRPLFVQFCANDPDVLLEACMILLKDHDGIDAIDLNFGCPQMIAKRGNYGSYLMDDLPLVKKLVETLHEKLPVPVTCKIRIFPKLEDTIAYAKMLEDAGCQILTVHGRTRVMKGHNKGLADWDVIKKVKDSVKIPVFSNGNILSFQDIEKCLQYTGCDGVMVAETLLNNPSLFSNDQSIDKVVLCLEYLDFCEKYPTAVPMVRHHIFYMIGSVLNLHHDIRSTISDSREFSDLVKAIKELKYRVDNNIVTPEDPSIIEKKEQRKKKKLDHIVKNDGEKKEEEEKL